MVEPEAGRVQAHAPQRVVPAPVLAIADDRMAERGELRPDLPAAAGLKLDLDERRVAVAFQHAVVADGRLAAAAVARRPHAKAAVLDQARLERARVGPHDAFDAGDVHALGRPRLELLLERVLDAAGAREDERAGGLAIEPMHHEHAAAAPRLLPVTQQAVHGALTLALGGDREQADRLVDDQDGAVLVDQSQRRRKGGRRRRAQYHAVIGRDGDVAATDRKSTRLNSSHTVISYAVFCLKKKINVLDA